MTEVLIIACVAVASLFAIARLSLAPQDATAGVAVIFTPWTKAAPAMARAVDAGGRFVRFGNFPFIVVVAPERPDYVSRILAEGALFAVDPQVLAACLTLFSGAQQPQ